MEYALCSLVVTVERACSVPINILALDEDNGELANRKLMRLSCLLSTQLMQSSCNVHELSMRTKLQDTVKATLGGSVTQFCRMPDYDVPG